MTSPKVAQITVSPAENHVEVLSVLISEEKPDEMRVSFSFTAKSLENLDFFLVVVTFVGVKLLDSEIRILGILFGYRMFSVAVRSSWNDGWVVTCPARKL